MNPGNRIGGLAALLLGLALLSACEVRRPPRVVRMARPTISLHEAVRLDNRDELALNRAVGADINARDGGGRTPLHIAAELGRVAAADLLISWGADVNAQDAHGRSPMHAAAAAGHAGIERLLISASANVNATDTEGLTPVLVAHLQNRQDVFDLLIAAGAEFDFAPEVEEWVPAPAPPAAVAAPAAPEPRRIQGSFRTWTSASAAQIEAEFVDIVTDMVILRTPRDELLRIPITRLQREDQILARELSGAAKPRLVRRAPTPSEGGSTSAASLGPRIGKQNSWTILENCHLLHNDSNDGDSVHISHQGKEYIFRLYYVDAPETSLNFPQRVEDQGRYFDLNTEEALGIGHKAARFTAQALGGNALTVATQWEDARGQSALPRYYAFITTPNGDLDELLVAEGLARIYGMPIDSSLGDQKRQHLKRLESRARQNHKGGWTKAKPGEGPAEG